MAFPATPLDLLVELQLGDEWVDVTAYVRAASGIELSRGRPAQQSSATADPAHLTLTLENVDGRFTPRNPRSAYYGLLTRNTPIRVSVRPRLTTTTMADLADAFGRTVAAGDTWGDADTGQTWTARNSGVLTNKHSVSSGAGKLLCSSANDIVGTIIDNVDAVWNDVNYFATFTVPAATGSGSIRLTLTSRRYVTIAGTAMANGPFVQALCNVGGTVTLRAFTADQVQIGSDVTVSGLTHSGQALRMRMQTAGLTVMGKIWDASGAEPAAWGVTGTDSLAEDGVRGAGSASLSVQPLTGNTNVPFTASVDNVAITAIEPLFCGEIASWPASWTPGASTTKGDVTVSIEAYGILRRINRPSKQPPQAALYRYINAHKDLTTDVLAGTTWALTAYWALTDGQLATAGQPTLTGGGKVAVMDVVPTSGHSKNEYFSQGDLNAPWLDNVIAMQGADSFLGAANMAATTTSGTKRWAVDWVRSGAESATGTLMQVFTKEGSSWQVKCAPPSTCLIIDPDGDTADTVAAATAIPLFDGAPHHLRLIVFETGALEWDALLYIDGAAALPGAASYIAPATTLSPVKYVKHIDAAAHTTRYAAGHVTVWTGQGPDIEETAKAALGYTAIDAITFTGETAGERIIRLCGEEGIPLRYIATVPDIPGDPTLTETVGPQPTAAPIDLIRAAADADHGLLYECRGELGLTYRARESLEDQAAALALTYTTDGHLQPGLQPTDDDVQVVNDVTATRLFGSDSRYQVTTGPLSVSAPPDGVGRYDSKVNVTVLSDTRALHCAEWLANLGTVDESRWPAIPQALHHIATHSLSALYASAIRADLGDRLTIATLPDFLAPKTVDQLIQGYTERLDQYTWNRDWITAPATPYAVGVWEGSGEFLGRWDAELSTLAANATSSATSLSVATSSGSLWTTAGGDVPFDINISGVRITVTAISGASSPQTFTVTRSTDGFDIALLSGAAVTLWAPTRWGL